MPTDMGFGFRGSRFSKSLGFRGLGERPLHSRGFGVGGFLGFKGSAV